MAVKRDARRPWYDEILEHARRFNADGHIAGFQEADLKPIFDAANANTDEVVRLGVEMDSAPAKESGTNAAADEKIAKYKLLTRGTDGSESEATKAFQVTPATTKAPRPKAPKAKLPEWT